MSMTDTAEYWWDIKNSKRKKLFLHIKGFDCGHFHVAETNKLDHVTCYACLRHIENTPELKQKVEQIKLDKEKHRFRFGKCICGSPMCERTNKSTGIKFLGCTNFPECKHTKKI